MQVRRYTRRHARRIGFTLLEVILASSISVLLLGALYVALDLQIRMAQTGREEVEKATIVRAIFARVTRDLLPSLTPITAVKSSASASTTTAATDTSTATSDNVPIAAGVIGDGNTLTIFTSRVVGPNDIVDNSGLDEGGSQPSDQRRINYWLSSSSTIGLCRQEEKLLTADSIETSTTPDTQNEMNHLIAAEVTSLQFEYFDGSNWNDSWDGSTLAADGVTPMGPPKAIRVHLWIKSSKSEDPKEYRKVIALLTGPSSPTTDTTTVDSTGTTTP